MHHLDPAVLLLVSLAAAAPMMLASRRLAAQARSCSSRGGRERATKRAALWDLAAFAVLVAGGAVALTN